MRSSTTESSLLSIGWCLVCGVLICIQYMDLTGCSFPVQDSNSRERLLDLTRGSRSIGKRATSDYTKLTDFN